MDDRSKRNFNLSDRVYVAAQSQAKREGRTVTDVVNQLLSDYANGDRIDKIESVMNDLVKRVEKLESKK